jgi:hypothetical protein
MSKHINNSVSYGVHEITSTLPIKRLHNTPWCRETIGLCYMYWMWSERNKFQPEAWLPSQVYCGFLQSALTNASVFKKWL